MAANQAPSQPKTFDELIEAAAADAATIAAVGGSSVGAGLVDLGPGAAGFAWHATLPVDLEIVREIHRGGQGVVYQAIHTATSQIVAVKVLSGLRVLHHSDRIRFERETEILRGFRHPGIVTIIDSGIVGDCHYIVMDFVEGERLDEYVAAKKPPLAQTLGLFAAVCEAVNAAHLRGVIHRDLKPGNILVDRAGCPRVLDFGLAKVVSDGDGEQSLTAPGQFVGSLPWASPEQAEGRQSDIDTRSDVYSLGVILYQLLTGQFPYGVHGTMRETLDQIAGAAPVLPRSIQRDIDDETETIVLKCLAKERERRYETAGDLARDLRRKLAGEAIEAKRDSRSYVFRKFVRRNRGLVFASGLLVATLALGLAGTLWQAQRAAERAQAAERAETEQRRLAEAETRARARAEAINEFVKKALSSWDPNQGGRQETLVADAMMNALKEIDAGAFKDDPQTEAGLRHTIATILKNNGRAATAEPLYVQALEMHRKLFPGDHPEVATGLNDLALARQVLGRLADAELLFQQALEMWQRIHPGDHSDVATGLNNLAYVRQVLGREAEAEPLYEQALAMWQRLYPSDHPGVAQGLNNLANVRHALARAADAEPLYEQALEMKRRLYPGDHPDVAITLNNLAYVRMDLGRAAESETLLVQAQEMLQRLYPGDHPDLGRGLNNLAFVRRYLGRAAQAEPLYEQALEMWQRLYPGDHPDTATTMENLAEVRRELGRAAEAEPIYEQSLRMKQRLYPGDHPDVANSLIGLASALQQLGRAAEAEPLFEQALEMWRRLYPGDHHDVATGLSGLAGARRALGRTAEAERLYQEALAICRRLYAGDHSDVATHLGNLANVQRELGRAAEAEPLYQQALEMRQRLFPADHPDVANSLSNLANVRLALGRAAEAEPLYAQALEILRGALPPGHPHALYPQIGLARTLVPLGRHAEAEPLLRDAAEQCQNSPESQRMHWRSVLQESVRLYESWDTAEPGAGHDSQAAEWRTKLAEWQASTQPAEP